jgi:ATP-dependent Lon protease
MMASQSASAFKSAEKTSLSAALARIGNSLAASPVAAKAPVGSRPVTSSTTHSSAVVDDICIKLHYPLNAADRDHWVHILSLLPHAVASVLDMFNNGTEVIKKIIEAEFSDETESWLLAQASRLSDFAVALKKDPTLRPYLDVRAFDTALHRATSIRAREMNDNDRERLRFLRGVDEQGLLRRPCAIPDPERILALIEHYPNFAAPLRFLAEQCALARLRGDSTLRDIRLLLLGPAGVGKTYFSSALAKVLDTSFEVLSMASQSCGFTLAGLDPGWSTGKSGLILNCLMNNIGKTLSPVILLDEIDKAQQESKSDPLGPLFSLLEPDSARSFRDEYASEFSIDASHLFWIATANENTIPQAILSRFQVFYVDLPTKEQAARIAETVYAELAAGLPGAPEKMPHKWRDHLAGQSIRDIRKSLREKLGALALRAVSKGQGHIEVDVDLALPETGKSAGRIAGIGFV